MFSILIDEEKCNCCGLCVCVCPNEILVKRSDACSPMVTDGECFGCENCMVICEAGAIRIIEEGEDAPNGTKT